METSADFADSGYAALVGDVIKSRLHVSRNHMQKLLREALEIVNDQVPAAQELRITVGDEFQGLYSDLAAALEATLLVRLQLAGRVDIRFGVGWGPLYTFDPSEVPYSQDGPTWWAARDAIENVSRILGGREVPRGLRTRFFLGGHRQGRADMSNLESAQLPLPGSTPTLPEPGFLRAETEGLINALLICRDELVGRMDEREARLLLGLLSGRSQTELAELEGISQSAISQRLSRSGSYAVLEANSALEGSLRWLS